MGYTHYWRQKALILDPITFRAFAADCQTVCLKSEIPIAGWDGTGKPRFTAKEVAFNGVEACTHLQRDLGITWPSDDAVGGIHIPSGPDGSWFAGATLRSRTCDGSCAHETFRIEQHRKPQKWGTPGDDGWFAFCKTAYKPYDILVTACLIIVRQHFPEIFSVSSDGEQRDWEDAMRLCQHVLGYGDTFVLSI